MYNTKEVRLRVSQAWSNTVYPLSPAQMPKTVHKLSENKHFYDN